MVASVAVRLPDNGREALATGKTSMGLWRQIVGRRCGGPEKLE
jgi:hypothetical protein